MIHEYYCPESMDEALKLLEQTDPPVYPLGGGSILSQPTAARYAVVDLQHLGLSRIEVRGEITHIGATTTLQAVVDDKSLPQALRAAAKREVSFNMRQAATVAGTIVASRGSSPFTTALLALGARLVWLPDEKQVELGEYLGSRQSRAQGKLITEILIPSGINLRYEDVARTPADIPIVCAAAVTFLDGRMRVALGGPGDTPVLVMDGKNFDEAADLAYTAYSHKFVAGLSEKTYLQEMSRVLVRRLLAE